MNERKEITKQYILDAREEFKKGSFDVEAVVKHIIENLEINEAPVNVWKIARDLGLEVFEANFKNNNVSGSIIVANEIPDILKKFGVKEAIILNRNEDPKVQSFTIAHELGHYVMDISGGNSFFENYHISKEKNSMLSEKEKNYKKIEDRADKFAALLLMPEKEFLTYYNNSTIRDSDKIYEEMANNFMVPIEAVKRRFDELNISRNHVAD